MYYSRYKYNSRVARILLCWRDAWGGGTAGAGGSTEHLPRQRDEETRPEPRHFLPHRERQDHRLSDSLCLGWVLPSGRLQVHGCTQVLSRLAKVINWLNDFTSFHFKFLKKSWCFTFHSLSIQEEWHNAETSPLWLYDGTPDGPAQHGAAQPRAGAADTQHTRDALLQEEWDGNMAWSRNITSY